MKIKYFGDPDVLIRYVGQAKKYLKALKDNMKRIGLSSSFKTYHLEGTDVTIKVESHYGNDFIYLYGKEEVIYFVARMNDSTADFSKKQYYKLEGNHLIEVTKDEVERYTGYKLLDDGLYYYKYYLPPPSSEAELFNPNRYVFKGDEDDENFLGIPSHITPFPSKIKINGLYRYVLNMSYEQELFIDNRVYIAASKRIFPVVNPTCQLTSNFFIGTPSQTYATSYTDKGVILNYPVELTDSQDIGGVVTLTTSKLEKNELNMNFYLLLNSDLVFVPFDKDEPRRILREFDPNEMMVTGWASGTVDLKRDKLNIFVLNDNDKYLLAKNCRVTCCIHCGLLARLYDSYEDALSKCKKAYYARYTSYKKYKFYIEDLDGNKISEINFTKKDDVAYISQMLMTTKCCCEETDVYGWPYDYTSTGDPRYTWCDSTSKYPNKCKKMMKTFPDFFYKNNCIFPRFITRLPFSDIEDDIKIIHSTTPQGGLNYRRFQKTNDDISGNILTAKVGVYCNDKLVEESEWFSVIQDYEYYQIEDFGLSGSYTLKHNYDIVAAYNNNGFDILFYRKYTLKDIKEYDYIYDEGGEKIRGISSYEEYCALGIDHPLKIRDAIVEVTNHIYVNGKIHTLKPKCIQHELYLTIDRTPRYSGACDYLPWKDSYVWNPVSASFGSDGLGNIIEEEDKINEQILRIFLDSNENFALFVGDVYPIKLYRKASVILSNPIVKAPVFDIVYPAVDKTYDDPVYGTFKGKLALPSDGLYGAPNDRLWLIFTKDGNMIEVESPVKTDKNGNVEVDENGKPKIWNRCNGVMIV